MATFTILSKLPSAKDWFEAMNWNVVTKSAGSVLLTNADGTATLINGNGFVFDGDRPTGGVITQIRHFDTPALVTHVATLLPNPGQTLEGLFDAIGAETAGATLLALADTVDTSAVTGVTVNGHAGNDDIQLGPSTLNASNKNLVHAVGGSDSIRAVLLPGSHHDWVSYEFNPDGNANKLGFFIALNWPPGGGAPPDEWLAQGIAHDLSPGVNPGTTGIVENDALYGINHVIGSYGDDVIYGQQWYDPLTDPVLGGSTVHALDGDDVVINGKTVFGGDGGDHIEARRRGGDYFGQQGDDTIRFARAFDADSLIVADGGTGTDTLTFGADATTGGLGLAGYAADLDLGRAFATDLIPTLPDNWTLFSIENLTLGKGDDVATGSSVANVILAFGGADYVEGHDDGDTIDAGDGDDTVFGDFDPNGIYVGFADLFGGKDVIHAGGGEDFVDGGLGNDTLYGGGEADTLHGGGGNDTLLGEAGADSLFGGDGTDIASYLTAASRVKVALDGSIAAAGHALGDTFDSIERLQGTSTGNDTLVGNSGNNTLLGEGGKDTLDGKDGADTLRGGDGIDFLTGGKGNDSFNIQSPGEGADRVLDFSNAAGNNDRFTFLSAGFGDLPGGAIGGNLLQVSNAANAQGPDVRFIYELDTGKLRYDADGQGGGAAVVLAIISGAPVLTAADIVIV